jgi:flagellar biosynthesis protein
MPIMSDYGEKDEKSLKFKRIDDNANKVAVAVKDNREGMKTPTITAAARGALAEKIMQIAFENDIKIREDADLAEILAQMELDNPVPTEALMAVAEILSYVYRANGEPDPFNAILNPAEGTEDL